jgi:hypothetical protein
MRGGLRSARNRSPLCLWLRSEGGETSYRCSEPVLGWRPSPKTLRIPARWDLQNHQNPVLYVLKVPLLPNSVKSQHNSIGKTIWFDRLFTVASGRSELR